MHDITMLILKWNDDMSCYNIMFYGGTVHINHIIAAIAIGAFVGYCIVQKSKMDKLLVAQMPHYSGHKCLYLLMCLCSQKTPTGNFHMVYAS